jgi:hypothetical protein
MRTYISALMLALTIATPVMAADTGTNPLPMFLKDFSLHGFDSIIPQSMGYDTGSTVYFSEMGSVSEWELNVRNQYEPYGCFPFYFMKDGKVAELGFNCRTFFCTGFQKGPKQCRDKDNKVFGGVVEMNTRMSSVAKGPEKVYFADFPEAQQTPDMQQAVKDMSTLQCKPYYLRHYDVLVGQGYDCKEIGAYPYYSPKTLCSDNWLTGDGMQCTNPLDDEGIKARLKALQMSAVSSNSSSTSSLPAVAPAGAKAGSSSSSSLTSSSSASSATSATVIFPDVLQGKYGYTAITQLASRGVITGYTDGTFRPMTTITRAELTKLALQGLHSGTVSIESNCFGDVKKEEWFSAAVCTAKNLGWVKGYKDGLFRPTRTISMAEGITMLMATVPNVDTSNIALPDGIDENAWYAPAVKKAIALGVLREPIFQPQSLMTRADAAVWIYRASNQSQALAIAK